MKDSDFILLAVAGLVVLNWPGLGGVGSGTNQPITLWQKIWNASGYTGSL